MKILRFRHSNFLIFEVLFYIFLAFSPTQDQPFDNSIMSEKGESNIVFAYLRPFPNMVGNYKYRNIEVSIRNTPKKDKKGWDKNGKTNNLPSSKAGS